MKNLFVWVTAPPVISVPIVIFTYTMSTNKGSSVPAGIWALVILFLIALTIIYIWTLSHNMMRWSIPLQFIAQGGVMAILAIQFGLQLISWVGVLFIMIGLILSGAIVLLSGNSSTMNLNKLPAYDIFESCPFPACVSDKNGSVISVSHGLEQLLGKNKNELWQINVDSFIPQSGKIQLGEKLLQVIKKESDDKTWYMLGEKSLSQQNVKQNINPDMLIKDSGTDIYSREFCRLRTDEEMARIKRYKRWTVFMLVKINFKNINEEQTSINKQSENTFFRSYCAFVKNALRNCDTVSRVNEFSVFIILPETLSGEPVEEVTKKILNFSNQLSDIINQIKCKISPSISHVFYNASSQDMSFNDILITLNNNLSVHDYT